jgi:diaminopimelate decarboxylase
MNALPNVAVGREWRNVAALAVALCGTPAYVTRQRPIEEALAQLEAGYGATVYSWLSFKTHPLPALLAWWRGTGRGVEVVSEVELIAARQLGCSTEQLLVNGVAKHSWLHRHPIPRLRVHFDSPGEIDGLLSLALQCEWRVGIRVHAPDERDARDGHFGGQFGMTTDEAVSSLRRLERAGAKVESIHFHLGQRPQSPQAYSRAVAELASVCRAASFRPRFVDCGGGLPSVSDAGPALAGLRTAIAEAQAEFSPELEQVWLENGRFVTQQSTVLAVRVLDVKDRPECRYLICDGGRTNHALAADQGPHPLLLVSDHPAKSRLTTVCGPTCMTDDTLGRFQLPETITVGDVLIWTEAGAYHLPWETRFSQGLCAIAWCDGLDIPTVVRVRERPDEWVKPWAS